MLNNMLISILTVSAAGALLAGLIIAARPLTGKFLSPTWRYYIWLTVLIVMLSPARIHIPEPEPSAAIVTSEAAQPEDESLDTISAAGTEAAFVRVDDADLTNTPTQKTFPNAMGILWAIGAGMTFAVYILGYVRLILKIRRGSLPLNCPEVKKYTRRNIRVRTMTDTSAPFIVGIVRPVLVLPDAELTNEQLDNILRHETTHLRRGDLIIKWLTALVKALHWFNPAVYYIARQINADCEIACDMAVVKHMSKSEEMSYIKTILSLISGGTKSVPLTTGMTGGKKDLKKRFVMIKNRRSVSKKTVIVSAALAAALLTLIIFAGGIVNDKLLGRFGSQTVNAAVDEAADEGFNMLFVGLDSGGRADTFMIISASRDGASVLSIPRNAVLSGADNRRITDIYAGDDGDEQTVNAVQSSLAIPINYYAKADIGAVQKLLECIGNFEASVPMDMEYDDPYQDLHISLKRGTQVLNAEQICDLIRFRRSNDGTGYTNGDLGRIETDQSVVFETLSRIGNDEIGEKIPELCRIVSENFAANFKTDDILKHIDPIKNILSGNVRMYTLPGELSASDSGTLIYKVNPTDAEELLSAEFRK